MKAKILLLCLMFAVSVFAQQTDWQEYLQNTTAPLIVMNDVEAGSQSAAIVQNNDVKSVKKALFYSLVIPGAGQYYNGSWKKALGFLTVEAASWAMYFVNDAEGTDIENEFQDYADTHWSEDEYWNWISVQSGLPSNDLDALRNWEQSAFSHGLHVEKDQQYYEMIGKYYQFNWGWDDFRSDPSYNINMDVSEMTHNKYISDNRLHYEDRRDASNQAFKRATTGVTIAVFNHIISAFEAAWSTKIHNNKVQTALRLEPRYYNNKQYTALTLRMNW